MSFKFNALTAKLDLVVKSIFTITSAADHETLHYDTATSKWVNNDTFKIDSDNSVAVKATKKMIFDGG